MPGIIKRVVPKVELSQIAVELIDKGFNRFAFRPFEDNKRFVELKAWRIREK